MPKTTGNDAQAAKEKTKEKEIEAIYSRQFQTLYRVCYAFMKNSPDTQDAIAETFLRMIKSQVTFESKEHEKAWLIRVASNVCKNLLRHWWRKGRSSQEEYELLGHDEAMPVDGVMDSVMKLPDKYKTVVYLHYYEGYTSVEIAKILGKPDSTVRNQLLRARNMLKSMLGSEFGGEGH